MFGHQNDVIAQDQHADAAVPLPESTINALTNAPATTSETDSPAPAASAPAMDDGVMLDPVDTTVSAPQTVVAPSAPSTDGFISPSIQAPGTASFPSYTLPDPPVAASDPVGPAAESNTSVLKSDTGTSLPEDNDTPKPEAEAPKEPEVVSLTGPEADASKSGDASSTPLSPDDLLKIKQEALQSLSPLVGKLDVSPQEKFRTLMMLIQASDDHAKLTEAYEVAKIIKDEKARAQALLDVVNEINYFTQKHDSD